LLIHRIITNNLNYFVDKIVSDLVENCKINSSGQGSPKVLVAPLDWGLGHATRCIPIINQLLIAGCEVIIASEGSQKALLSAEFPDLKHTELRGYRIKFGGNRLIGLFRIILQIPKILIQIKRENNWLRQFLRAEKIDIVIADNRYGLYSPKIFSVFLTHQLLISSPFGKRVEKRLQKINYRFIDKFNCCWIPDLEKENGYAGKLSHPRLLPRVPIYYIGLLSRFEITMPQVTRYDILLLLSGPEPQRTEFEKLLLKECNNFPGRVLLVRGLPAAGNQEKLFPGIETHNHLPAMALNKIICESDYIICRPGYSTVMDIIKLGSKSIMVPTPGQTEQEYLAAYLLENKIAYSSSQENFSLPEVMERVCNFKFLQKEYTDPGLLGPAIDLAVNRTA
jgi:UDP:flavonoid glycosyltransferase YjiC (YdhE family)